MRLSLFSTKNNNISRVNSNSIIRGYGTIKKINFAFVFIHFVAIIYITIERKLNKYTLSQFP